MVNISASACSCEEKHFNIELENSMSHTIKFEPIIVTKKYFAALVRPALTVLLLPHVMPMAMPVTLCFVMPQQTNLKAWSVTAEVAVVCQ